MDFDVQIMDFDVNIMDVDVKIMHLDTNIMDLDVKIMILMWKSWILIMNCTSLGNFDFETYILDILGFVCGNFVQGTSAKLFSIIV